MSDTDDDDDDEITTDAERAAEALPFPPPAFDREQALDDIAAQNRRVGVARDSFEHAAERARDLKKTWEIETMRLGSLIRELDTRRQQAERLTREPLLAPVDDFAMIDELNAAPRIGPPPGTFDDDITVPPPPPPESQDPGREIRDGGRARRKAARS